MEKFEIFKLRLCKGLFNGIISDYILAVVKSTEHILEGPILAEILDDSYVTKFKDYIHGNYNPQNEMFSHFGTKR